MKGKPDPDIGESDMQLYLLEPNIESIAVWTSSHCGKNVVLVYNRRILE